MDTDSHMEHKSQTPPPEAVRDGSLWRAGKQQIKDAGQERGAAAVGRACPHFPHARNANTNTKYDVPLDTNANTIFGVPSQF